MPRFVPCAAFEIGHDAPTQLRSWQVAAGRSWRPRRRAYLESIPFSESKSGFPCRVHVAWSLSPVTKRDVNQRTIDWLRDFPHTINLLLITAMRCFLVRKT